MDNQTDPQSVRSAVATAPQVPLSWMTEKGLVKLRPRGLKLVTMLLFVDQILSIGFIGPDQRNSTGEIAAILFVKLLWFWILWYFWKGRNWSRILTMLSAAFIFLFPFLPPKHSSVMQVYMVATSVFSAYLLYCLNTKPIVRFFKESGNGVSNAG